MRETAEPLAKFHAKVDKMGRILIPKYVREVFEITENDYLLVLVRLISINNKNKKVYVSEAFKFTGKVNTKGVVVIPKPKRDQLNIKSGQLLEVLLLDIHRPDDQNLSTSYTYVFL